MYREYTVIVARETRHDVVASHRRHVDVASAQAALVTVVVPADNQSDRAAGTGDVVVPAEGSSTYARA